MASTAVPETRYATSGEVSVAYQAFGDGPMNLVVVPGWLSHVEMNWDNPGFARLYRRLATFARVAVFDKRGTGLSDRNVGVAPLEERIDDMRAVMDAAGMARASVLGWSEGGPMQLLFAATFPDRVDSMVVYGAAPVWRAMPDVPGSATAEAFAVGMLEEFFTGVSPSSPHDRVLATVLFTDIVASTNTATQLRDRRWRDLLEEHDRLALGIVERHRGRLVKSTGDGILAVFDGPGRAVRCALELSSVVRTLGLQIRAGVHTGEIEQHHDGDISGIAVHLASRVQATAAADQVLVTRTVVDLTHGSELTYTTQGNFTLTGIDTAWELFLASA